MRIHTLKQSTILSNQLKYKVLVLLAPILAGSITFHLGAPRPRLIAGVFSWIHDRDIFHLCDKKHQPKLPVYWVKRLREGKQAGWQTALDSKSGYRKVVPAMTKRSLSWCRPRRRLSIPVLGTSIALKVLTFKAFFILCVSEILTFSRLLPFFLTQIWHTVWHTTCSAKLLVSRYYSVAWSDLNDHSIINQSKTKVLIMILRNYKLRRAVDTAVIKFTVSLFYIEHCRFHRKQ
jgi:hypothetical protein